MRYRVNFGNCQVSHRFPTQRAAREYIAQCAQQGSDPYTPHYFVEKREIGTADDPGDWFPVTERK